MLPPTLIQGRPNETYGWSAVRAPITKSDIAIDVTVAGDRYADIAARRRGQDRHHHHRAAAVDGTNGFVACSKSAVAVPTKMPFLYELDQSAKQIEAGVMSSGTVQPVPV
jgi:hypothetical protein